MKNLHKIPLLNNNTRAVVSALILQAPLSILMAQGPIFGDRITEFAIRISSENLTVLAESPARSVPAEVAAGPGQFSSIELSVFAPDSLKVTGSKPSLKVQFKSAAPELGLDAGSALVLDNSALDPSYLGQYAAAELAQLMRLPSARAGHTLLTLNNRKMGLYLASEVVNEACVKRVIGDGSGRLFSRSELLAMAQKVTHPSGDRQTNGIASDPSPDSAANAALRTLLAQVPPANNGAPFLAWMTFAQPLLGTVPSLGDYSLHARDSGPCVTFIAGRVTRAFSPDNVEVFLRNNDPILSALMHSGAGRLQLIRTLDEMVATTNLQARLLAKLHDRQSRLRDCLAGPAQLVRFEFNSRLMNERIQNRFSWLRTYLGGLRSHDEKSLASIPYPRSSVTDSTVLTRLPGVNSWDLSEKFRTAYRQAADSNAAGRPEIENVHIVDHKNELISLHSFSTNWVSVDLTTGASAFTNVGFRLKGKSTRQSLRGKPSFTLKFNQFNANQKSARSPKTHYENAIYDPSYLNRYLVSVMFQRAGLPCQRVSFAHVWINDSDYGLYLRVEGATRSLLERELGTSKGRLFEGVRTDLIGMLDPDFDSVSAAGPTITQLQAPLRATLSSNNWSEAARHVDGAKFARYVGLEVLLGLSDGYSFNRNNYRVFEAADAGQLALLPHGADLLDLGRDSGLMPPPDGILTRAMWNSSEGRALYRAQMAELLNRTVDEEAVVTCLAQATVSIQRVLRRTDPFSTSQQMAAAIQLANRLCERRDYLLMHLRENNGHYADAKLRSGN